MRRIAQETINRVLEEVDIFEVISQYVDLKKRGKNYFGLSPFRSETKPSFSVAPDKNMWYDFGSGQGGNAVGFLIEYEKISFSEAVRSLAEKYTGFISLLSLALRLKCGNLNMDLQMA